MIDISFEMGSEGYVEYIIKTENRHTAAKRLWKKYFKKMK